MALPRCALQHQRHRHRLDADAACLLVQPGVGEAQRLLVKPPVTVELVRLHRRGSVGGCGWVGVGVSVKRSGFLSYNRSSLPLLHFPRLPFPTPP
eukprot:195002-Chlamydomonas_euryale.AAC.2